VRQHVDGCDMHKRSVLQIIVAKVAHIGSDQGKKLVEKCGNLVLSPFWIANSFPPPASLVICGSRAMERRSS